DARVVTDPRTARGGGATRLRRAARLLITATGARPVGALGSSVASGVQIRVGATRAGCAATVRRAAVATVDAAGNAVASRADQSERHDRRHQQPPHRLTTVHLGADLRRAIAGMQPLYTCGSNPWRDRVRVVGNRRRPDGGGSRALDLR